MKYYFNSEQTTYLMNLVKRDLNRVNFRCNSLDNILEKLKKGHEKYVDQFTRAKENKINPAEKEYKKIFGENK